MKNEVKIMNKVQHENIVASVTNFEDSKNIYLVLDLAEDEHLYTRLRKVKKYPERTAAKVCNFPLRIFAFRIFALRIFALRNIFLEFIRGVCLILNSTCSMCSRL